MENAILDSSLVKQGNFGPPWWIKTFTWIFLVAVLIIPVGIVFGLYVNKLQFNKVSECKGDYCFAWKKR